jgi:hypothetical protein
MPWSLFTYTAIVKDWRHWYANRFSIKNKKITYSYSVIFILALIISVSNQQAPHYLLPTIPFIAIITARCINDVCFKDQYPRTYKWMLIARTITVFLIWPMVFVIIIYFFPTRNLLIWIPISLLLLLLIYSYIIPVSRIHKLIIPLLVTILALCFTVNTVYMPSALKYHGPIQASYLYNKTAPDNSKLYTYNYVHFETYFYPKNVSAWIDEGELESILSKESCWLITTETGFTEITDFNEAIITEQHSFPYKKLTNASIKFLNPKTREGELQKIYLLKIR